MCFIFCMSCICVHMLQEQTALFQVRQWNPVKHPALCPLFLSPASIMSALGAACGRQLALDWPFLHRAAQPVWVKALCLPWTTWGSSAERRLGSQTLHREKQQFCMAPWSFVDPLIRKRTQPALSLLTYCTRSWVSQKSVPQGKSNRNNTCCRQLKQPWMLWRMKKRHTLFYLYFLSSLTDDLPKQSPLSKACQSQTENQTLPLCYPVTFKAKWCTNLKIVSILCQTQWLGLTGKQRRQQQLREVNWASNPCMGNPSMWNQQEPLSEYV